MKEEPKYLKDSTSSRIISILDEAFNLVELTPGPNYQCYLTANIQAAITHWRRKRGGQLKTRLSTVKADLTQMSGLGVYNLRRWNREGLSLGITWTQDRQTWAAAIRDVVVVVDTGTTSLGRMSSQVSK